MWVIHIYNTETGMSGYLSGDVYGNLVPKDEGWLNNIFVAADRAQQHVEHKPHLFYRLEQK